MKGPAVFLIFHLCIWKSGTASKGWSMHVPSQVTGEIGQTVSLPCTFTHPHQTNDKTLTAIWRVKEPYNGTVVFKCVAHSSSSVCKTAISSKNRYQLLGNPRQNNLSLQIHNLTWNDSSKYFCRVEFSGDAHDKYESRMGIRLHLIAAPRIVNISVQSGEDHSFDAKCTAEGEPLPTLTWTGPLSSNVTSVSSVSYQTTKELRHLTQDGRYTCTAVNSLGRAEGAVYFYKYRAGGRSWILNLLFVSLGIKALALLLILGVGAFWKGGRYDSLALIFFFKG
ncbi:sialic acid-binding Ig-like lectin 15 [Heteronotia binoei]|uniref:sialic acid-binding Ig-like lectin 15 n=1 Tax=Heteronotia binoei TaxID=13085 RepID=UPI00292F60A8|nr:sialic acid-binding Ig-like lectin 15 [Heteronotia binoei]